MNVLPCSINTLKGLYDISGVEVGQHFYWQIGGFQVHAQVLITSWFVIAILLEFFEYVLEFIRDLSKTQIGEGYGPWLPHGELAAPTNDINTTVALALPTFTKPLSLSFRLFGNILADELVVVVLVSLVPSVVPIPVMFLGLFTSGIQALIFAT
ncbi:hypothetical protein AQUCO_03800148v1 [Aquilegia coerulea]|uniref:Uncharacterized protein n=1 Tax=Aquilegia coerulea TaxID=218851 RepID=A0A2G5CT20_AQUCA|nr:hypothetical protein AQUCO_03800148v1 [Aquilegia coerulea]